MNGDVQYSREYITAESGVILNSLLLRQTRAIKTGGCISVFGGLARERGSEGTSRGKTKSARAY
jgi:hypothetical protein